VASLTPFAASATRLTAVPGACARSEHHAAAVPHSRAVYLGAVRSALYAVRSAWPKVTEATAVSGVAPEDDFPIETKEGIHGFYVGCMRYLLRR
jgi:hypothetical protein